MQARRLLWPASPHRKHNLPNTRPLRELTVSAVYKNVSAVYEIVSVLYDIVSAVH
jgi:hypothetical protein